MVTKSKAELEHPKPRKGFGSEAEAGEEALDDVFDLSEGVFVSQSWDNFVGELDIEALLFCK